MPNFLCARADVSIGRNSKKRQLTMSKRKLQLWITVFALGLLIGGGRQTRDVTAQTPQANQVRIVLTAVDRNLQFVSTLRPEDLRITQDGAPQKIVSFQQVTNQA